MTPLETKIAQALSVDLTDQSVYRFAGFISTDWINTERLALLVTKTIREEMAVTLRDVAARRQAEARTVNAEIDKVIA